jgi:hypothetical protein
VAGLMVAMAMSMTPIGRRRESYHHIVCRTLLFYSKDLKSRQRMPFSKECRWGQKITDTG